MEIKFQEPMFYTGDSRAPTAKIVYEKKDAKTLIAKETFVDPSLRGQGVAKHLLDRLAQYAREHDLKIIAECSYVVSAFQRYIEYADVML